MSKILILAGIIVLILDKASCFYNQSYEGYTFILPDVVIDHSNSWLVQLSFSGAQRWCTENVAGSTLATIPNKDVQQNIARYIESGIKTNKHMDITGKINFRVNGKYHNTDAWQWLNGHPNSGIRVRQLNNKSMEQYGYACLWGGDSSDIIAAPPYFSTFYICERPGTSNQCITFPNGRCYQIKHNSSTCHNARNDCLDGGGDLASFENFDFNDIKMSLNLHYYWIGLQKNFWRWKDTDTEIKYSYWAGGHPNEYRGECICLNNRSKIGGWTWKECNCSTPYPFICMLNDTSDSSALTTSDKTSAIIIIASCSAIIVVIIIIAAVSIAKKRRNSDALQVVKSSGYESPKCAMTESSMDFPVYAEIEEPKETNCASDTTYASVQMTSKSGEKHPVSNVVYAELDLTSRA